MQARRTAFMSFALALAVHLAAEGSARADDALPMTRATAALGGVSSALTRDLVNAGLLTSGASYLPAFVASDGKAPGANRRAPGSRLNLDALLRGSDALELLGAFVLPGRRGVTVATSDGMPTLSLAMMRTDITRGSGLCAMGKF